MENTKAIQKLKCGHKGSAGRPCRNGAGHGTTHPGIGYCHYHDRESGAITPAGRHLPLLQMLDESMRPLVVAMIEDDDILFDLRFELATLRSRYAREVAKGEESSASLMIATANSIALVATRLADLERSKHMFIHVSILSEVLEIVGKTARVYLDTDKANAFSKDLKSGVRKVLPDLTARGIATSALVTPIERGILGESH